MKSLRPLWAVLNVLFLGLTLGRCQPASSTRLAATNNTVQNNLTRPVFPWPKAGDPAPVCGPAAAPGENGNGNMDGFLDELLANGQAELRYIIDPQDGTYKSKVTIPKNFTGPLYLSGLNITSLNDKIIQVRFNFGREMEAITLPATITRGQGITPQTDIEVVALNITGHPFENLRLFYDLYDYHDYDTANNEEVITDPRNDHLYCRGLRQEHDPTIPLGQVGCQNEGDTCLYSYAKIRDAGLAWPADDSGDHGFLYINPQGPQINLAGGLFMNNDTCPQARQKCLPDNLSLENLTSILSCGGEATTTSSDEVNWGMDVYFTAEGESPATGHQYFYRGPYRPINQNQWEIKEKAVWGPKGIYGQYAKTNALGQHANYDCYDANSNAYNYSCGLKSHLFPKSGRLDLRTNVKYLGSVEDQIAKDGHIQGLQTITTKAGNGASNYMDGCNYRASYFDAYRQEGIGSCNVTATIELLTIDPETNQETVHASSSALKLQIVRASKENNEGQEVLYSAMRTCTSSHNCAADQCCYNYRCWSKDIVAQCREEVHVEGNLQVGEVCRSDLECTTLCCNSATSRCGIHINTSTEQVLCGKSPGQSCISREWCRKENVTTCFIVKTVRTANGKQECALRCYNVPTHGYCRAGVCVSPPIPEVPSFDPTEDPETRCAEAIDPPNDF